MQIRTKLTLQFIVLVAGILLLSLYFIDFKFRTLMVSEFYDSLRSKALMTAEMVLHDADKLQPLEAAKTPSNVPFKDNIVIYDAQLRKIFAFNPASDPVPADNLNNLNQKGEYRGCNGDNYVLGLWHQASNGHHYLVVAESRFNPSELANLRRILVFTFLLGIGIVAFGGWFYAGQAMEPVARIVNQVDNIHPSDLSARLQTSGNRDELSRLAATMNRLLDRIQYAFHLQKGFISNVSHELKNPLSAIISQLEVALSRRREPQEYHDTLESVLDDSRQLNNIAEKLLQLARLHTEVHEIPLAPARIDEIVLQARDGLLRAHPDYHIAFDIDALPESEEEMVVNVNEPLLRIAVLNLMENGCKFSPDNVVDVRIRFQADQGPEIYIQDNGPGIPEKDLPLIFQPFFRGSANPKVRGSGIGLSLVDTILKLHEIKLEIKSGQGRGTLFLLRFPQTISRDKINHETLELVV